MSEKRARSRYFVPKFRPNVSRVEVSPTVSLNFRSLSLMRAHACTRTPSKANALPYLHSSLHLPPARRQRFALPLQGHLVAAPPGGLLLGRAARALGSAGFRLRFAATLAQLLGVDLRISQEQEQQLSPTFKCQSAVRRDKRMNHLKRVNEQ